MSLMEAEPPRSAFQGWGRNEAENSSFVIRKSQISNFKFQIIDPDSDSCFHIAVLRFHWPSEPEPIGSVAERTATSDGLRVYCRGASPKGVGSLFLRVAGWYVSLEVDTN